MVCQAGFDQWRTTIMQHLAHLSKPQATVLALWSFGMVLARSCALTAVSHLLAKGMKRQEQTVRQQLREWYYEAPRKRGAKRHIGGALLVASVDHTQGFGRALEGVEQMIVVDARQRIDGVDPVRDQSRHRSLGGRHFGHRWARLRLFSGFGHEYSITLKTNCAGRGQACRGTYASPSFVALTKLTPHALFARFTPRF